jgi:AAA domain
LKFGVVGFRVVSNDDHATPAFNAAALKETQEIPIQQGARPEAASDEEHRRFRLWPRLDVSARRVRRVSRRLSGRDLYSARYARRRNRARSQTGSASGLADAYDRYELKLDPVNSAKLREWADAVLFVSWDVRITENAEGRVRGVGGKDRIIYTTHSAAYDAKNRVGLPEKLKCEFSALLTLARRFRRSGEPASAASGRLRTLHHHTNGVIEGGSGCG